MTLQLRLGLDTRKLLHRIVHHVIHNRLRGEDLVDLRCDAPKEPRTACNGLLRVMVQFVLMRDDALRGKLLDLFLTILLPVVITRRVKRIESRRDSRD